MMNGGWSALPLAAKVTILMIAAVALVMTLRVPVLGADEPTGELDRSNADIILELLTGLNAGGRTVIIASHDDRTLAVAGRRLVLDAGRLISVG